MGQRKDIINRNPLKRRNKLFKITLEFLEENNARQVDIDWFLGQNKPEMTVQELKQAGCPDDYIEWVDNYRLNQNINLSPYVDPNHIIQAMHEWDKKYNWEKD